MNPVTTLKYYLSVSSDFSVFERIRFYVTMFSAMVGTTLSYAGFAAIGAKYLFSFSGQNALVFVGLPIGTAVTLWLAPKLPRILGFTSLE